MDEAITPAAWAAWTRIVTRNTDSFLRQFARKIPYRPLPFWQGQLLALGCVAAAAAIRFAASPIAHGRIPVVVFYPFVLIASVWGGTTSGLSTLIIGAMVADYFWLPRTSNFVTLTAFSIACLSVIFITRVFRVLVELHVEDQERAILLTHELRHRANNLYGVVQAISAQTARSAKSVSDHQSLFAARIGALARAQELVSENPESPPDLHTFLTAIIDPFEASRFDIDGPEVEVPASLGTSFALLVHELCTNATKYGSLSIPGGRVAIVWKLETDRVKLIWREAGGPEVSPPTRTGFGSRLLKTAFPSEFGDAGIRFDPAGVQCTVSFARLST